MSAQWLTNGTSVYYSGGNVGIGTSAPTNALHVFDPMNQGVGIFQNPNGRVGLGVDGSGGYLQADGINFSFFAGSQRILFGSSANGRVGIGTTSPVARFDVRDTTAGIGLFSVTGVSGGIAIRAINNGNSASGYGLLSDAGPGYGLASFGKYGVYGSGDFVGGAGVYGVSTKIGALAGKFMGDVEITGNLTKASGTFKIDHPLDPENKYLYHSFVESPEMMNVYRGRVVLDASGSAVIVMPSYFEALNREFEYQLTCIGGYSPVFVASEISGNQFVVAGGEPGMKVSWLVTGVRQDKYAELNRVQVEVEKAAEERGFYLHPEVFGKSADQAIPRLRHDEAIRKAKLNR